MNTETGTFQSVEGMSKDFEKEVLPNGKMKYKRFDLGEVIIVKGEEFMLQAVTDDCLILVPMAKLRAMKAV